MAPPSEDKEDHDCHNKKKNHDHDDDDEATEKIPYALLAPQAFVGLVDAVSYMVTAPSIVFYVLENGGSYDMYGMILASFSLASFLFKPVLGYWCDATHTFTAPYLCSLTVAAVGGFLYFWASSCTNATTAVACILLGRFLGGFGAASNTLGFTYVAHVIDKKVLTQASAVLSMVRVLGMTTAPAINIFLDKCNFAIPGTSLQVTPLNAVGLFLAAGNLAAALVIYLYFVEPGEVPHHHDPHDNVKDDGGGGYGEDDDDEPDQPKEEEEAATSKSSCAFWSSMLCMEILVPALSIFQLNTNFQLMETAMAPAANDALGFGPVGISALFGAQAVTILVAILVTFELSRRGMSDETLLSWGLGLSVVGYTLLYLLWQNPPAGGYTLLFFVPVLVANFGFPFTTAPTRSLFTLVVDCKPLLRDHQGTMQALLSMDASIAGFVAPSLISSFVLRSPEEVAASADSRELTLWALYAPLFSLLTLIGHLYVTLVLQPLAALDDEATAFVSEEGDDDYLLEDIDEEEEFDASSSLPFTTPATEDTALLASGRAGRPSVGPKQSSRRRLARSSVLLARHDPRRRRTRDFTSRTRARRRDTVTLMGIPQFTFEDFARDTLPARRRDALRRRRMTTGCMEGGGGGTATTTAAGAPGSGLSHQKIPSDRRGTTLF